MSTFRFRSLPSMKLLQNGCLTSYHCQSKIWKKFWTTCVQLQTEGVYSFCGVHFCQTPEMTWYLNWQSPREYNTL